MFFDNTIKKTRDSIITIIPPGGINTGCVGR